MVRPRIEVGIPPYLVNVAPWDRATLIAQFAMHAGSMLEYEEQVRTGVIEPVPVAPAAELALDFIGHIRNQIEHADHPTLF